MIVPSGTDVEALLMESTVGTATPLLLATKIIPSELVILYPDITLIYYELYIGGRNLLICFNNLINILRLSFNYY